MAITRQKKESVVSEVSSLLASSKMTVVASYPGTSVQALQSLRRSAKENGTTVRIVKNRLVMQAFGQDDRFKNTDTQSLRGQLLYAFNAEDEVAPAQSLDAFSKTNPTIKFIGGYTADGTFVSADDVKALASLPSKEQLRAMLAGTLAAPLSGFVNVLAGNVRGVLNVLNARADAIK